MCGIAGVYEGAARPVDARVVLDMAGELAHRGPDGSGLYLDGSLGMANTRLAIVDLAGGDQPLSDDSKRYFVVQNGEIYNHVELRQELESLGQRFATRSDTEVIAQAFARWGTGALDRMNGAFAFALWDRQDRRLLLVRDRLGKRPLFLTERDGALLFASEAKALFRYPGVERELDPVALVEQIELWTALGRSAFKGIRELAPGHVLERQADGSTREFPWWRLSLAEDARFATSSDEAIAEEVRALLDESVKLRLRADVPVAAYLSGGLDSSAIAVLAKRHAPRGLKVFGVRFDNPLFDERKEQETVARALDLPLDTIEVSSSDIAHALSDVVVHAERPMHRTAPGPLLLLSARVRAAGTKVVLTGEGADELFAGYHIFKEDKIRRFWARHPDSTMRPALLRRVHPYLARDLGQTGAFLTAFFGQGLTELGDPLYSHRLRFGNGARILRLLHRDLLLATTQESSATERLTHLLPPEYASYTPLARAQYLETVTFLQNYLLHSQGDRMLMANGVEGRFPFLDHRLVELAGSLPARSKLRGLRDKFVLRQAFEPRLPREIVRRAKQPYRAPILQALLGRGAPEAVSTALDPERIRASGFFDPQAVDLLIAKCRRRLDAGVGEVDEMALVLVATTMLLKERLIDAPRLAKPAEPGRVVVGAEVRSLGEL